LYLVFKHVLGLIARAGQGGDTAERFPIDATNRLRRDQLRGTIEQMRIMLLGNTFFAPILSIQAWNTGSKTLIILWTAGILLYSWWLFFFSWQRTYQTNGSARDMRRFVIETFFNSLAWAIGAALFYPMVQGDQKAVFTTVMAGALALGTMGFSRAPAAGLTYLGVQTVGNSLVVFLCALQRGSWTDSLIGFLIIAAGISLFNATVERGKSAMVAFKNHEQLSEKSEVVELLLKDYEEQATEWLWQTDRHGCMLSAPDQILELLGPFPDGHEQANLCTVLAARCTPESQDDIGRLQTGFQGQTEFHDVRLSLRDPKDAELRWILMKGRPQFDRDGFSGFRGIFADATVAIVAERKVKYLAAYDSLTGLLNRNSVQKRLLDLRAADHFATAFFIDLDGFKQVNDSYGHNIGDLLLQTVAKRLRENIAHDAWAARLGGDEFFILITAAQPMNTAEISWIAQDICDRLSQPVLVEDFDIQVSASIGIARFPENTTQGTELLSLSDMALYEAKSAGRNRVTFFDVGMQNRLNQRSAILERLKIAVRDGAIVPYYQSQHALSDGRLIGFEALARWIDDELGLVGPDVFIPIAEQTGLIVELGEQLLRKACLDARKWAAVMQDHPPVVSVNFSPVQFARTDVTSLVARVLAETGLAPDLLEVEVTEGVLIASKERIAATLAELSDLGVSIALDDFGTGYSSLSYLKALPLNRLKIDRSFVNDLSEQSASPIVSTIIQLGHNLGLSVIAEGVEDQTQVETLADLGCDDAQGYFFSRPMTVDATDEFVARAFTATTGERTSSRAG